MTTKRCSKCGQEKDLAAFHSDAHAPDGRQYHCKACHTAYMRAWAKTTKGRANERRGRLKRQFGLTPEVYEVLLRHQGGACAVCGHTCPSGKRLAVDHDHVTGRTRGLLCTTCNTALGKLRDSHVLLAKAAAYLTRPPAYEILQPLDVSTTGE